MHLPTGKQCCKLAFQTRTSHCHCTVHDQKNNIEKSEKHLIFGYFEQLPVSCSFGSIGRSLHHSYSIGCPNLGYSKECWYEIHRDTRCHSRHSPGLAQSQLCVIPSGLLCFPAGERSRHHAGYPSMPFLASELAVLNRTYRTGKSRYGLRHR